MELQSGVKIRDLQLNPPGAERLKRLYKVLPEIKAFGEENIIFP